MNCIILFILYFCTYSTIFTQHSGASIKQPTTEMSKHTQKTGLVSEELSKKKAKETISLQEEHGRKLFEEYKPQSPQDKIALNNAIASGLITKLSNISTLFQKKLNTRSVNTYKKNLARAKEKYRKAFLEYKDIISPEKSHMHGPEGPGGYDRFQPKHVKARKAFIEAHNTMVDLYKQEQKIKNIFTEARENIEQQTNAPTETNISSVGRENFIDAFKKDINKMQESLATGFTREPVKISIKDTDIFSQALTNADTNFSKRIIETEAFDVKAEKQKQNDKNLEDLFQETNENLVLHNKIINKKKRINNFLKPIIDRINEVKRKINTQYLDTYTKKSEQVNATYQVAVDSLITAFKNEFTGSHSLDFNDGILQSQLNGESPLFGEQKQALDDYVKAYNNRIDVYREGQKLIKKLDSSIDILVRDIENTMKNNTLDIEQKRSAIDHFMSLIDQASEKKQSALESLSTTKEYKKINIHSGSEIIKEAYEEGSTYKEINFFTILKKRLQKLILRNPIPIVEGLNPLPEKSIFDEENPFHLDYP